MITYKFAHAAHGIRVFLLSTLFAWAGARAAPVFQPDGQIVAGDYRMELKPSGIICITDPEGIVYELIVPLSYPAGKDQEAQRVKVKDPKLAVDARTRSATLTSRVAPPNCKPFDVAYSMTLAGKGRVRVALKAMLEEPAKPYLGFRSELHVSREALVGGVIAVGAEKFPILSTAPAESQRFKYGAPEPVVLNAGNPAKQMTFTPVTEELFSVSDHNRVLHRPPFIALTFAPKGNELVFDIELPTAPPAVRSSDTYAGVDFWKNDQLHMPQYNLSRNLIQNPSFEAGFAYWHWASLGLFPNVPKYDEYSEISTVRPHHGKRVLALRGEVGQTPAEIATFAIPVEKGQDYTLSFYARGEDAKQRLGLNAQGFFTPPFMLWKTIEISGPEWKRYTFTFKATHPVLNVSFGNPTPQQDNWVYVDSVQLEKGAQATDFTTKPAIAWLTSDFRGNLWEPGTNPHAALHVHGAPGSVGKIRIKSTDFFGNETDRGTLDYKLDPGGEATLPLPWAADLPLGGHVVNIALTPKGGVLIKDTGRFTVMRFLKNQHLHKNLFAGHLSPTHGSWKRQAEFFKRAGLGATILFDPRSHAYHKTLSDNGILHFSSIFDGGEGFKNAMNWTQRDRFDLTPDQLKQIEELSYQKARDNPEIKYWKLLNEPECGPYINNLPNMNKMIDALIAARQGILRANPQAIIIGCDPANMYASAGVAFVDTQLQAIGNRKVHDIPAIHPYRTRPESPDRDAETKGFLDMLARHDYHGDVWFTEGIYHQNYNVPTWELNTHKGCSNDHYRAGALSYDCGWGEKIAAAYVARSWLVSLKYADRVKLDVDWGFYNGSSSDVDMTPCAMSFAANTLGHILGNATFKTDLALGYEVRCYVFQDEKNRPVAAIWYHNIESDKGKIPGPVLDVSALAGTSPALTYADFMGNPQPLKDKVRIGPFPIFVIGEPGETTGFIDALRKASLVDDKGALYASISTQSTTQAVIQVDNSINKPFKGKYKLLKGGVVIADESVTIPARQSWSRLVPQPLQPNALGVTALNIQLTAEGKSETASFELTQSAMAWPKRRIPLTLTGSLDEWQGAFRIPIHNQLQCPSYGAAPQKPVAWRGDGDCSATLYANWDEQNLYLAVAVTDDVLKPNPKPEAAWNGDSVQLYFDGWADGRKRRAKGFGPDDQTFAIWPQLPGSLIRREIAPERQLAFLDVGPVKDARLKVTRKGTLTLYEVALPVKDLNPIQLKAGEKFGFAPLVNDDDGDYRKRALMLTPPEVDPANCPDLFPTVILVP